MYVGKMAGCVMIVGVTAAICFWPEAKAPEAAPEPVRPVRSAVVRASARMPDLTFAGIVQASASRTLVFKQTGRVQGIAVSKGQAVKKGEKLAWLDPLDFQSALAQAEAQLKQSEAALELAKRALDETVLYAPFAGTIAEVPATELDMVGAANPIVKIQDTSFVNIDVSVAEKYILRREQFVDVEADDGRTVSFDSLPGRSFPVTFKEFQASADENTQTFVATYTMKAPKDLLLLPGMSATLTISGASYAQKGKGAAEGLTIVPESAVGVTSDGAHFVWLLEETAEKDVYEVRRQDVSLVRRTDEGTVVSGLKPDQRVATAGVSLLTDGRKVTIL